MLNRTRQILTISGLTAAAIAATGGAQASAATVTQSYPSQGGFVFVVPAGVRTITATIAGAGGGADGLNQGCVPGRGNVITVRMAVAPGDKLNVSVGGAGGNGSGAAGGGGGFNGGGSGGDATIASATSYGGGGGGGMTRVSD